MCDLWPGTWLILRLTSELLPSCVPTAGISSWCQVKIKIYVFCYTKSLLDWKKISTDIVHWEEVSILLRIGSCPLAGGDLGIVQDSSRSLHPAHLGVFLHFSWQKKEQQQPWSDCTEVSWLRKQGGGDIHKRLVSKLVIYGCVLSRKRNILWSNPTGWLNWLHLFL